MFFAKIPRHIRQNAITEGDLECILTRNCEGTEQLRMGFLFKKTSLLSCEDDHGAVASFYLQECVKTYSFRDQAFVLVILDVVTKKYLTRYIDKKSRYMRKSSLK